MADPPSVLDINELEKQKRQLEEALMQASCLQVDKVAEKDDEGKDKDDSHDQNQNHEDGSVNIGDVHEEYGDVDGKGSGVSGGELISKRSRHTSSSDNDRHRSHRRHHHYHQDNDGRRSHTRRRSRSPRRERVKSESRSRSPSPRNSSSKRDDDRYRSSREDYRSGEYERRRERDRDYYPERRRHDSEHRRNDVQGRGQRSERHGGENGHGHYSSNRDNGHDNRRRDDVKKRDEEEIITDDVNVALVDSDDEEALIEQRRLKRKALLEKLKNKNMKDDDVKTSHSVFTSVVTESLNEESTEVQEGSRTVEAKPSKAIKTVANMFAVDCDLAATSLVSLDAAGSTPAGAGDDINPTLTDNWDDHEGYYRPQLGEVLNDRYVVYGESNRGVFSCVVRARDRTNNNKPVAVKIIRANETMIKAGHKELDILRKLQERDIEDRYHCVRVFEEFMHRGHLCMVFEMLAWNLREVLKKFGKNVGINIHAVKSYAQQLFLSLKLLRKCGILHADIKPDNVLVSGSKAHLKLADFGSASTVSENEITPYLVSRFYRAPEIIIGHQYGTPLDIFSVGCTLFELYTGRIMFPGKSNNDMLRLMMEMRGKMSHKMIKRGQFHLQHFDEDFNFLSVEIDKATKNETVRTINTFKARDMLDVLLGETVVSEEEMIKVRNLKDIIERCTLLDPSKRITPSQALDHPFIKDKW